MIAVGIPSFNEADNIAQLVGIIDRAALLLDEPVLIINADNSSEDGTAEIFRATPTRNRKVSLTTPQRGKGRNIRCILDYIIENEISYCFFVDGDMTSMETDWLQKQCAEAGRGADYVVPNYARNLQEGNATNHLFFPALNYFSQGQAPHQPVAGDIGISSKFARYLKRLPWHRSTLGYGVDIFSTMHALFGGYKVVEISLDRKIHKPGYGKMLTIFEESATSYFVARNTIKAYRNVHFTREQSKPLVLLPGDPLPEREIAERARYARTLLTRNAHASLCPWQHFSQMESEGIDASTWASILVAHEKQVGLTDGATIARSLLPYYLLRVTHYLREATAPDRAEQALAAQTALIAARYAQAGL